MSDDSGCFLALGLAKAMGTTVGKYMYFFHFYEGNLGTLLNFTTRQQHNISKNPKSLSSLKKALSSSWRYSLEKHSLKQSNVVIL